MSDKKFISNIDNSKITYGEHYEDFNRAWPGTENMKVGCLQRIALATEAMAKNHIYMQEELEYYKQQCKNKTASIERLLKSNNALRGHCNRYRKLLKQKP